MQLQLSPRANQAEVTELALDKSGQDSSILP